MKFSDYLNHRLVEEEFNTLRRHHRGDRNWEEINEWYEEKFNDYDYLNEDDRLDEDDPTKAPLKVKLSACIKDKFGLSLLNRKENEKKGLKVETTSVPPEFVYYMSRTNTFKTSLKRINGFCNFVAVSENGCYSFEVEHPLIIIVKDEAERDTISVDNGLYKNCIIKLEDTKKFYICTNAEKQKWEEIDNPDNKIFCYDMENNKGIAVTSTKEEFLMLIARLRIPTNKNIFALTSDLRSLDFVKDCLEKFKKSQKEDERKVS